MRIKLTSVLVDDLPTEYERMSKPGVTFRSKPAKARPATGTRGNNIPIVHK